MTKRKGKMLNAIAELYTNRTNPHESIRIGRISDLAWLAGYRACQRSNRGMTLNDALAAINHGGIRAVVFDEDERPVQAVRKIVRLIDVNAALRAAWKAGK